MSTALESPPPIIPDESIAAEYELDASSNGTLMTSEEFDAVEDYDRDYRYELIHAVVIVNPIPGGGQNSPNDELGYLLRRYAEDHPQGSVIDETLPEQYVYVATSTRRIADRLVWTGLGHPPDLRRDIPTIAIEFNSRRRRDRRRDYEEKRDEYLSLGIKEYWVIDRFRRTMTVFRGTEEIVVKETETYTTARLPGFELPVGKLLSFADRYPQ